MFMMWRTFVLLIGVLLVGLSVSGCTSEHSSSKHVWAFKVGEEDYENFYEEIKSFSRKRSLNIEEIDSIPKYKYPNVKYFRIYNENIDITVNNFDPKEKDWVSKFVVTIHYDGADTHLVEESVSKLYNLLKGKWMEIDPPR